MSENLYERLALIEDKKSKVLHKKEEVGQVLKSFYQAISDGLDCFYTENKEGDILNLLVRGIADELDLEAIFFDDSMTFGSCFSYRKSCQEAESE